MPATPHLTLLDCQRHALKGHQALDLDDTYYAYDLRTDVLRGKLDGKPIVIKAWRAMSVAQSQRTKFIERLAKELDIWTSLKHPNIVEFLGVTQHRGQLPSLVLPDHPFDDAVSYLNKHPSTDVLQMLLGIASGISYMHSRTPPIIHGDIKGANIVVTNDGVPRLTDIRTGAIPAPPDWTIESRESARWMAPEVMYGGHEVDGEASNGAIDESNYVTTRSDVYSFAMVSLELYTRKAPFAHRRYFGGVIWDVVHGERPLRPLNTVAPQLTDEVWNIIKSCWQQKPKERPPIDVVYHWIHLKIMMDQMKATLN